ncbi:hypothetical protein EDB19DRAFT_1672188 [Suillus lakei]|nr:hypothetical protein EDB19DRAFT_1672188 [Suillus lakei]
MTIWMTSNDYLCSYLYLALHLSYPICFYSLCSCSCSALVYAACFVISSYGFFGAGLTLY